MKYNIWNKWDPLKVCMLGNNYAPEFFNGIPDKAGDPLKRICEETLEDLEGFKTILQDWVGYVEETVFDVNVLMLDEQHCCVSNPNNEQVNLFFKKHKIEPVHVPWRHRYFWDGGLHCITLDLYREGEQQDYFN